MRKWSFLLDPLYWIFGALFVFLILWPLWR